MGESQAREFQKKLLILHEVTIELSNVEKIDDLFRQAVVLGRERLGFDRLVLFLFDMDSQIIIGTYGTDMTGKLRDEREYL